MIEAYRIGVAMTLDPSRVLGPLADMLRQFGRVQQVTADTQGGLNAMQAAMRAAGQVAGGFAAAMERAAIAAARLAPADAMQMPLDFAPAAQPEKAAAVSDPAFADSVPHPAAGAFLAPIAAPAPSPAVPEIPALQVPRGLVETLAALPTAPVAEPPVLRLPPPAPVPPALAAPGLDTATLLRAIALRGGKNETTDVPVPSAQPGAAMEAMLKLPLAGDMIAPRDVQPAAPVPRVPPPELFLGTMDNRKHDPVASVPPPQMPFDLAPLFANTPEPAPRAVPATVPATRHDDTLAFLRGLTEAFRAQAQTREDRTEESPREPRRWRGPGDAPFPAAERAQNNDAAAFVIHMDGREIARGLARRADGALLGTAGFDGQRNMLATT